jgi:hypothetical protein
MHVISELQCYMSQFGRSSLLSSKKASAPFDGGTSLM